MSSSGWFQVTGTSQKSDVEAHLILTELRPCCRANVMSSLCWHPQILPPTPAAAQLLLRHVCASLLIAPFLNLRHGEWWSVLAMARLTLARDTCSCSCHHRSGNGICKQENGFLDNQTPGYLRTVFCFCVFFFVFFYFGCRRLWKDISELTVSRSLVNDSIWIKAKYATSLPLG